MSRKQKVKNMVKGKKIQKKMKIKYRKGCKIQGRRDVKEKRRKEIEENTIIITVASLLYDYYYHYVCK